MMSGALTARRGVEPEKATRVRLGAALLGVATAWLLLVACGKADETAPTATPAAPTATPPAQVSLQFDAGEGQGVPAGTDAAPPAESPALPGGAFGFSHYVFEKLGDGVVTTLVEGPRGEQFRVPASYLQLKRRYEAGDATSDLRMTRDELAELIGQLDTVRASTERFLDVEVALAEGYVQVTGEVPNMGAHFIHPWRSLDGVFDPARPEILLYVRNEAGEWELVGTSFVQALHVVGPDHPEAFAGPLDNWHVHYELCTGANFTSRSAPKRECKEDGGVWVPAYGWMIHAWVWVDNPLGVFNMWNPNIAPVASASDLHQAASVAGDLTVAIENFGFGAATVKAGDTLAWTNVDGVAHTITSGSRGRASGDFDSGLVGPGGSFQVKFDQPGLFSYTCTLHSFMAGTVVVTP